MLTYITIENVNLNLDNKLNQLYSHFHMHSCTGICTIVRLTERFSQRCYQDNSLDNTRAGEAEAVKDGSLGSYRQASTSLGPYRQVIKSLGP